MKTTAVWHGTKSLRNFLVPISDLKPFPGNARRGDVEEIRESLRRFGQVRPITTTDGATIVVGHHVVEAATLEGWTHISALPAEFADEEEARAYNVVDNAIHDLGGYDESLLALQLRALASKENGLAATGYDDESLKALEEKLAKLRNAEPPEEFPTLDPGTLATDYCCPNCGHRWSGKPKPGE